MTQSRTNGHDPDINFEEVTVYEPVFPANSDPDSDELALWHEIPFEGKEGEFVSELPPELESPEDPTQNN
jgi:hypothetical protein